jgi:eukaryotic-like serine/threonine-protein kinase
MERDSMRTPLTQPQDWSALSAQLDHALELDDEQRELWLETIRQRDPSLAERLRSMLAVSERPGFNEFLAGPPPLVAPVLDSGTLVGQSVGNYVIDAEIGRGGMGSVWRAHRADGRYAGNVAIKFVHAAWIGRSGEDRFRTEGILLGRLDHPNIARLLDAGMLAATQPYLVLEYVVGDPIDVYCESHTLGTEPRLRLFLDVLEAVAHAHSHLIVHRDLKPSNVFVTQDGTVKLLDFGIAKLLDEETGTGELTVSGLNALTPQYAAPEQLLGQPVTTATDVYALGNLLYVLLAGTHPLPADAQSKAEILKAIVTTSPPLASTVACLTCVSRRTLEGDLDNILNKALKKEPSERYASAAALGEDLRRHLAHQPVQARPDTLSYRTAKFVRRHRGGVAATALCVVAIIAGLVGTSWQARRADAAAIQATQQRERALQQLDYADATSEFLEILLQQGSDRPFTTPDLLARGERLIQGQFTNDPALHAKMLLTLGDLYGQASQQAKAVQLQAAAQRLAYQSTDRSLQVEADCDLAHEYGDQRLFDKALHALDTAITSAEATPTIDREVLAECRIERSEVRLDHGDVAPALADAETALDMLGPARDGQKTLLISARIAVADAKSALGDDAAAVREYRAAIDLLSGMGRGQTEYAASYYSNLGRDLARAGQWLQAAPVYEQYVKVSRDAAGGGAVDPAGLSNYGKLLIDLGRPNEAIQMFDAALQASIQLENPKGVAMATALSAPAFCAIGNLKECAARLNSAKEALATQLAPKSSTFGTLEMDAARLAWANNEPATARDHLRLALKIFGSAQDHNPNEMRSLALLTEVELRLGDTASAQNHGAELLAKAQAALHGFATSAWVGRAQLVQAEVMQSLGKSEEANATLQQALAALRATVGAQAPWTLQAQKLLGG